MWPFKSKEKPRRLFLTIVASRDNADGYTIRTVHCEVCLTDREATWRRASDDFTCRLCGTSGDLDAIQAHTRMLLEEVRRREMAVRAEEEKKAAREAAEQERRRLKGGRVIDTEIP